LRLSMSSHTCSSSSQPGREASFKLSLEASTCVMLRWQMSKPKAPRHADQVYHELLKRYMLPSEYEQLKRRCDMGECVLYLEATSREPWIADVLTAWKARKVKQRSPVVIAFDGAESRYLYRFLKVGVLKCRRHPVDFGLVDGRLLCDRAPVRNRAACLPDDFPGD